MIDIIQKIEQLDYDFYFLVVDNYLSIDTKNTPSNFYQIYAYTPEILNKNDFCLEKNGIKIEEKNTGKLLFHPKTIEYIKNNSIGKKVAIIPFKPSAKIDNICKENNWLVVSNESKINRILEDKIKFNEICKSNNIPTIQSEIVVLNEVNFENLQQKFGEKLVIQTHFGWAGNSTFCFSRYKDVIKKILPETIIKVSPYLNGISLLNNCCLIDSQLIQSPPALQFTGLKDFTSNEFSTVGRQWPSLVNNNIENKIKEITQNFSQILNKYNYKGYFGLDFFVDDNENIYMLECNPRITASFDFYLKIEINNNINPLFYFHILSFLNRSFEIDTEKEKERFYNKNIIGSEITKRNDNNQIIKKLNSFEIFTEQTNPIIIKKEILNKF